MKKSIKAMHATVSILFNFLIIGITQLLLSPLILKYTDTVTLGNFATILQILGFLAVLDFGFTGAFQRSLAQSYNIEKKEQTKILLLSSRIWFSMVDFVRATLGLLIVIVIGLLSITGKQSGLILNEFLFIACWYMLRGWLMIYAPALMALQNIHYVSYLTALSVVFRLLVSIILLELNYELRAVVLGIIFSEMLLNVGCLIIYNRKYEKISSNSDKILISNLKPIIFLGLKSTPIAFASVSKQQSDGLIIATTLGPVAVSIFYTTKIPILLCVNLIHSIITTMTPAIYQMHAQIQSAHLRRTFKNLHRLNFLLSLTLIFGLLLFHERFTALWVGIDQYAGAYVTIVFSLTILFTTTYNVNFQFIYARGEVKFLSLLSIIETFMGVLIAYYVSQVYGVPGVVTVMLLMNTITSSYLWYITFRYFSFNLFEFLRSSLLAPAVSVAISVLLTQLCSMIVPLGHLVLEMIVFMLISCSITYLVVLSKRDKVMLRRFLRRM